MSTRILFAVSSLCAAVAAVMPGAAFAQDGVYQATTLGRNGDVTVEVTIKADKIADVKIVDWSETHPIADVPAVKIPADIVKYQTTAVDTVSGATLTSFAITGAVRECLKEAGLDPKAFSKRVPVAPKATGTVEETTDIVVVGAGGAGLSAALAASQKGKNVLVVEKTHYAGGNTSVAGGCYNAFDKNPQVYPDMTPGRRAMVDEILAETPKNELQKELIAKVKEQLAAYDVSGAKQVFDSVELHALQTWKAGDYQGDLELVYELAKGSPKMHDMLMQMGFKWREKTEQAVGALWPRSNRASNYKSGVGFIDTFLDEIKGEKLPVSFMMNTKVTDLILENGRVVGVKAQSVDGRDYVLRAKQGVVLASGGFGANVDMRMKYDEIWNKKLTNEVKTTNVPGITGDGIVMAEKAGVQLVDMGYIQLLPTTDPQTGATNHSVSPSTAPYVNVKGERFVNEMGRRDELSRAALAQPGHKFFVLGTTDNLMTDKEGRNQYGIKMSNLIAQRKVFVADTWEELGRVAGIDPKGLVKTVEAWNAFCRNPAKDPFGRPSCDPNVRLDGKGPFYATAMTPSVHHTMGGVKITTKAEAVGTDGKVIPGLWAAGEVTGDIHGTNRVGCNAVPDALVFGRIAGISAAENK